MLKTSLAEPGVETFTGQKPRPWLAVGTLCQRELVRFFRQRNRVVSAIAQPLVFWVLFGVGFAESFRVGPSAEAGVTYSEYAYPGMLVLVLMFTAIFTSISVIEDRREGFLQSVLVAPVPRWALVCGKLFGASSIALIQGLLFLPLVYFAGVTVHPAAVALIVLFLALVAFALTALGFTFAWRMDSSQGFHAVMSVVLFPMWLLSGAFFPGGTGWLGWIIRLNPLSYSVAGLRRLMYWGQVDTAALTGVPSAFTCWSVTLVFALVTFALAWKVAGVRTQGDLV